MSTGGHQPPQVTSSPAPAHPPAAPPAEQQDVSNQHGPPSNAATQQQQQQQEQHAPAAPAQQQTPPTKVAVPRELQNCDSAFVSQLVMEMISRLILHNDRIPLTSATITRFHSRAPPAIKPEDYLRRVVKYASVEPSVIITILVYIDRICDIHQHFTISSLTVHRFIIAAVTVGSKALSDIYCTNTYYARVGGLPLTELNLIEMDFCKMIGWRLSCSMEVLQQYYVNLVRTNPGFDLMH
ncbi:cyclin-domain-containing protein [Fimicolochytrium jonesii]|uniref:cyclin-domain-containing protein n=1 Tax=Fimicolochytrium jonesii TaxID=1396493 RepID=UPI0022FDF6D4|nr:cyclin-domain-containing protein [Fimicolochytrium jonesii]KAI8816817.1 cyclin-domain-containing protein [Fimicolochytrium jonesii]